MTKQQLRKTYQEKRQSLAADVYADLNNRLLEQFKTLNFNQVQLIHIFLPIRDKREPDTFLLINWLKQAHPGIRLAYPKADFSGSTMKHYMDNAALKLENNAFGIPEPVAGNEVDTATIDLVIVPLLAFDQRGYRVGYGKGFYDRFMAACKPGTIFTGLCFFEPVQAIDDINDYDVPLNQCITPEKIWLFKP